MPATGRQRTARPFRTTSETQSILHNFPCNSFGFELSKRKNTHHTDVSVCIHGNNLQRLRDRLMASANLAEHPVRHEVLQMLLRAETNSLPLRIWLEFDAEELQKEIPTPSLFVGSSEGTLSEAFAAACTIESIVPAELKQIFESTFFDPNTIASCLYLGRMYPRSPDSLRLTYRSESPAFINQVLGRHGIHFPSKYFSVFTVSEIGGVYCTLDFLRAPQGRFALEIFPQRDYQTWEYTAWVEGLNRELGFNILSGLSRRTICQSMIQDPASLLGAELSQWTCTVSHLKLTLDNNEISEVKPYFLYRRSSAEQW